MNQDEEIQYRERAKYGEQLSVLGLFSLEKIWIRRNTTEIYKIVSYLILFQFENKRASNEGVGNAVVVRTVELFVKG